VGLEVVPATLMVQVLRQMEHLIKVMLVEALLDLVLEIILQRGAVAPGLLVVV
jgi:hypothetical protein